MPSSISDAEPDSPDSFIKSSISALNHEFLASIGGDVTKIISFLDSLRSLNSTVEKMKSNLSEQTLRMAHDLFIVVNVVVGSLLDLDNGAKIATQELAADLDALLTGVSLVSIEDKACPKSTDGEPSTRAPYVKMAYEWLLSNLHNPYPSKEVRSRIASFNNTSQRLVDAWFVDARKRIGWNLVCKEHFSSRKEMVDAATHFFQGKPIASTSARLVERALSADELAFIFISLENRARGMYSSKFNQAVEVEVSASCRGRKRSEGQEDARPLKRKRRAPYPSPPASEQGSPEPALPSQDVSQDRDDSSVTTTANVATYRPPSPTLTTGASSPAPAVKQLVTSHPSHRQPLSPKRKRNSSSERQAPSSKRARRTVSAPTPPSLEPAYNPALEALTVPFQVESVDFSIDTPPSVAVVPLGENVEWDTSRFQQFVASLRREETPELSECGSSPSLTSSPGLSASPSLEIIPAVETVDFTTLSDPSSQILVAIEPQPLIFETNYANMYESSQVMFSSLLEPSGQYDGPLPPLNIMPSTWMEELQHDDLNAWCLPPTDKTFSGLPEYQAPQLTLVDDRNAKLLRAQQLREELRRLEQDIHA